MPTRHPITLSSGRVLPARYSKTRVYKCWMGMIARCEKPKTHKYRLYGGRGIQVCERWRSSFVTFLEDMGEPPTPRHTIDRYPNPSGNYEPGNCRWATYTEQNRNRFGYNILITWKGETKTIGEWAEITGLHWSTIRNRHKKGKTAEEIFAPDNRLLYLTIDGVTKKVCEWEKVSGTHRSTIAFRIGKGLAPRDAVFLPLQPRKRLTRQDSQSNADAPEGQIQEDLRR